MAVNFNRNNRMGNRTATSQTVKVRADQVANHEGGYVFQISPLVSLKN